MNAPVLYVIIPCYNEEKVIETTASLVTHKLNHYITSGLVSPQSRICFVEDGSADRTWPILCALRDANERIVLLRHNRNYGEQYAYLTGIRFASAYADCMITMDADLQDDIDASDAMLDAYFRGSDVVYGVRRSRPEDRIFQKLTSALFYQLMRLCGTKLVPEHSQYRLMSRKAAERIVAHTELNIFLPALVPLLGLPESSIVYYDRKPREAGETHYNVRSLSRLASNAILSYGVRLPYFLLLCAVTDAAFSILAAWLRCTGANPRMWTPIAAICLTGAILFGALYAVARRESNRHLRAKNRPDRKG